MKTIRYAVVGLGHIAQVAVLPAFKHAKKNSLLSALVTGTPKKAKTLSKKYKVAAIYSYKEYDTLLKSGTIDAVYIALPNRLHCEYSVRALEAGIHVLCEKPLALSQKECLQMLAASKKTGAKLMTAYRLHFDKPTQDAIALCQSGRLGNLKTFSSSFSYVFQDKQNIRLQPQEGGGPLWDIGIYCINAARYLFKENPVEVFAYGTRQPSGPFSKVDETVTAALRFPRDRTAVFTCSFNSAASSYFEVFGDKGMLRLQNSYEYAHPPKLTTVIGEKRSKKKYKKVDQFAAELTYFSKCILKNKKIEPSGQEGRVDVEIMEAIDESIQSGRSVKVRYDSETKKATPKPAMVETFPSVRKPELVDVRSASAD